MRPSRLVLFVKRLCDVAIGSCGSLAFALAWPVLGLLIKLESPGPVLYSQERIGINKRRRPRRRAGAVTDPERLRPRAADLGGRPFTIYKFRSMREDAEKDGPQLARKGRDPRVTRVGWWLRALHLDELPQFWNILKGDMSFIGPRPERAHFTLEFGRSIPHYHHRMLFVRPGLTGLAQIMLGYDESMESVIRKTFYDYSYRASMCSFPSWVRMEAWILWSTVLYLLRPPQRDGEVRELEGLKRAKRLPFLVRHPRKSGPPRTSARINLHGSNYPVIVTDPVLDDSGRNLEMTFNRRKSLEVTFTPSTDFDLEDLGFLINLSYKVKDIGGQLSIRSSNRRIVRLLREIHLDKVVRIRKLPAMVTNFLTVDVECWFHAFNLKGKVPPAVWHLQETNIAANVGKILRILEAHGTRATFFVLGWVADHFPDVVRMIDAAGHEIGTHGYYHMLITDMTPAKFEEDLAKSLESLARLTSRPVRGHRASNFSVVANTLWSLEILRKHGIEYDSSIFPIHRDRYGIPHYPNRLPHRIILPSGDTIVELPMSTLGVGKKFLPMSGGGYLRLFPHQVTERFIEMRNQKGHPAMVYFHPWELDVDQKKINAGLVRTFQHYVNLHTTEWKLRRLLENFRFGAAAEVLRQKPVAPMLNRNPVHLVEGVFAAFPAAAKRPLPAERPKEPSATLADANGHAVPWCR